MLKVFGNVYSDNKDNFDVIVRALEREGFEIAYNTENSGVVEKEVSNLNEDSEDVES